MRKNFKQKGFTLIELLVVIAVIGILAAVIMASLNNARIKGRDGNRISQMREIKTALALYYDTYQTYPGSNNSWYDIENCNNGYANFSTVMPSSFMRTLSADPASKCHWYFKTADDHYYLLMEPENPDILTQDDPSCYANGQSTYYCMQP